MPMSPSASSSPTPSSTSRVMMTGLIGPDLRREDCWSGPSHDDWRKTCLMESWNPAEKLGISHGRSSKDGLPHLSRAAHDYVVLPAPHAVPRGGATFQDGRPASARGPAEALPDGGAFCCARSQAAGGAARCGHSMLPGSTPQSSCSPMAVLLLCRACQH